MTVETAPPVTLSARAAEQIARILAGEGADAKLRVSVSGGGCSGFSYGFGFDPSAADDDFVIKEGNAVVLIDPVSLDYLKGSQIDWVDELIGASFQIRNPNAKSSCGCGTSFAV